MSLSILYRCVRSLEAIENYAIARKWRFLGKGVRQGSLKYHSSNPSSSDNSPLSSSNLVSENTYYFRSDKEFWKMILASPNQTYGQTFNFGYLALSDWVARVPGLFWSQGAKTLREQAKSAIDLKSLEWTVYHPLGKSQLVLGGVGTFKFSPDVMGNRLVTLSNGHNASSGIPAIISPEVWDHYKLNQGDILSVEAKWQEMPLGWAEQFPSIRGIPRGCLVIRNPRQIFGVEARKQPVQFHPCTIMEYHSGDAILYDFVYATADTSITDYRQVLERFFDEYKDRNERYGKYLLPADHSTPLFDAEYAGASKWGDQFHLNLLKQRVRKRSFKGQTIDELLQALTSNCSNDDLQVLSRDIKLPISIWYTGAASARSADQLLDICIQKKKVEELVDALALQKPSLVD